MPPFDPIRIYVKNPNGDFIPASHDEITNALVSIQSPHHEIHEGEMWISSVIFDSVNDDATMALLITVGEKEAHAVYAASLGGDVYIQLYASPVVSDAGTDLDAVPMNRARKEVATVEVTHTPTVSNNGDLLFEIYVPGGLGGNAVGDQSSIRPNTEWILNPTKTYLIVATNKSGQARAGSINVQWYEED